VEYPRPAAMHRDASTTPRNPSTRRRSLVAAGAVALGAVTLPVLASAQSATASSLANKFKQINLIANKASLGAKLVDPNLTNAWGLAAGPSSPIWVSDNNSGMATVYSGGMMGGPVSLDLTVPVPGGNPTGQVFNPTSKFKVGGQNGSPAIFIVATDSVGAMQSPGEIAAWNGGASFVVEDSPTGGPGGTTPAGAVFKGLALSTTAMAGPELLAADVANGRVDIFDGKFAPVNAPTEFVDPAIPTGYAPFGIQELNGEIYVTYGKQNATKTDVVPGAGLGFVDKYSVDGALIKHLVSGGSGSPLNEPWGLAIAPAGFGPFAGKLLVGNLGNGWINVFKPKSGKYLGALKTPSGQPIVIDGLWGLRVGNSAFGGPTSVIFSAGPNTNQDGLVGILKPKK
jgi:uncharacterized protein (TIGR03118 family)